ncbi:hypothetical protein WMY93_006075 [Mugilogobius chulae]|uniref:Uncharacterized protein n=1 Tax=Mugilogobius chulae TaxID=88201 RepID=A0AAW0PJL0_9GOBI
MVFVAQVNGGAGQEPLSVASPSRVEQVVGRWLRRSRDLGSRSHSAGRDRSTSEEKTSQPSVPEPRSYAFRFSVQLQRDPGFCSHGLTLSSHTPIVVQDITPANEAMDRCQTADHWPEYKTKR